MSARIRSTLAEAPPHETLPEEPAVDPIDDALWHLHFEACRLAQLVAQHGIGPAQRRDLRRSLAVLRDAAEWQPARERETEPAL